MRLRFLRLNITYILNYSSNINGAINVVQTRFGEKREKPYYFEGENTIQWPNNLRLHLILIGYQWPLIKNAHHRLYSQETKKQTGNDNNHQQSNHQENKRAI